MLCKKEDNVKHVVLKLVQWATPALAFLKAKYPKIKLVFNTRHPRIQVWDPLPKVLGTTIFYFWYPPIVAFLANRKDYSHLVLFEDLTENPTQTVRERPLEGS